MARRALVVADDLTGAMDSGHEFAARGFETVLALDGGAPNGENAEPLACEVLVVDTDSRSVSAENAARAVEDAIDAHPAGIVYEKIDSTLRGNLVPEIDAALATAGADLALLAPAFPATGRETSEGTHLVDGVPVTEAFEGKEGPASAHLPTVLADSAYPVVECSIEVVSRGAGAVREFLASVCRPAIVACDATEEDNLDAIACAASEVDGDVLYVGSAGLARHVRLPEAEPIDAKPAVSEPVGNGSTTGGSEHSGRVGESRVLAIAGSANPRTIEGITALPVDWVIGLDLPEAIAEPGAAASEASGRAIEALSDGKPAVVTSAPDAGAIERAREAGQVADLKDVGERIECTLAAVAETVYAENTPESLFLTGGAVAERVLGALDATGVRLTGEAIERGVPVGRVVGGRADGVALATKAGGFGTRETIANCLAHLRQGTTDHE